MSTTPDSFHRTEDFESRIESVLLPNEAWAVFAHLEKPVTVAEIARRLECDPAEVQKQVDLLVQHKLARKHLVNWRDFLAQKGISTGPTRMSPAGPQPPPVALAEKARRPAAPAAVPAPRPAAPVRVAPADVPPTVGATPSAGTPAAPVRRRQPEPEIADPEGTISFTLANENARRSRRASIAMSITFRLGRTSATPPARIAPAATPAPVATAVRTEPEVVEAPSFAEPAVTDRTDISSTGTTLVRPRKLRPLIEAITRKGGGGLNGQLLVYRVFLRVPPALMFNAGIKSLSLVDDSLELQDEETYSVIRAAAQSVASIDLDAVGA